MDDATKVSKLPFYKTAALTVYGSIKAIVGTSLGWMTPERGQALIDWWWRRVLEAGDATLHVEGRERLDPDRPYLFMSNHSSLLDIPVLFGAFPGRLRMVAKTELRKVPIFGKALERMEFVFIDRSNPARAIQQLDHAKVHLERGVSVWIAPEGTRSRTGKLGPFKKGGFHLAVQLGVPIVPTWIEGTSDVVPPDTFDVRYGGHITVRFGEPIATEGKTKDDVPTLLREVREALLALSSKPRELVDGGDVVQGKDARAREVSPGNPPRPASSAEPPPPSGAAAA